MAEEKLASRWLVSTEWLAARLDRSERGRPRRFVLSREPQTGCGRRIPRRPYSGRAALRHRRDLGQIQCPAPHAAVARAVRPTGRCTRRRRRHDDRALRRHRPLRRGAGVVDVSHVRLRQCPCARWRNAEVESREPPPRERPRQTAHSQDLHGEIQSQPTRLDRRRAKGVARQDRAGRRRALVRPLPRRGARAAPRHSRRPHAGLLQCPVRRGAQGWPAPVAPM